MRISLLFSGIQVFLMMAIMNSIPHRVEAQYEEPAHYLQFYQSASLNDNFNLLCEVGSGNLYDGGTCNLVQSHSAEASKRALLLQISNIDTDTVAKPKKDDRKSFYIEPGTTATKRVSYPPDYAKSIFSKKQTSGNDINLYLGFDFRNRTEYRRNDIRRSESFNEDLPFLIRERLFIGVSGIAGFLGMSVEVEDAHSFNSEYTITGNTRDFNRIEPIRIQLDFRFNSLLPKDALGNTRPIILNVGRMNLEYLDRRLISANPWRNTTNTFSGATISLGEDKNDWQIDLLALQPINRRIYHIDTTNTDQYFGGIIAHWRRWSQNITLEPHYLALIQNASANNGNRRREIHAVALRVYGWIKGTNFNYELTGMLQSGEDNKQTMNAHSFVSEIGYTFKNFSSKPRISFFYGIASGDKDPNDNENNRFERFFGFSRPWNSDDYVQMENIKSPKIRVEAEPVKGLLFDGGYSLYWLQSSTDRFSTLLEGSAANRDRNGLSGKYIGHGFDTRVRFRIIKSLNINAGYSKFYNGEFVIARQEAVNNLSANSSDFAYIELSLNALTLLQELQNKRKVSN